MISFDQLPELERLAGVDVDVGCLALEPRLVDEQRLFGSDTRLPDAPLASGSEPMLITDRRAALAVRPTPATMSRR